MILRALLVRRSVVWNRFICKRLRVDRLSSTSFDSDPTPDQVCRVRRNRAFNRSIGLFCRLKIVSLVLWWLGLICLLFALSAGFNLSYHVMGPLVVRNVLLGDVLGSIKHAPFLPTKGAGNQSRLSWKLSLWRSAGSEKEAVFRPLFLARPTKVLRLWSPKAASVFP